MLRELGLFGVLGLIVLSHGAVAKDRLDLWCDAHLSLDASGKVTALEFIGKNGNADPVAMKLLPIIHNWAFEPGSVDGVQMSTETTLSLHLQSQRIADGGYALRIADAHTGAAMGGMRPPNYPAQQLIDETEAKVLADVTVDVDGVPTRIEIADIRTSRIKDGVAKKAFEAAVIEAAKTWRLHPEVVGGHAMTSRVRVPVEFCISEESCEHLPSPHIAQGEAMPSNRPVALDSRVKLITQVVGITF